MRQSLVTRLALHAANLLMIAFLLLPIAAATIGALQSEKSLQASTRSLLPPEWTFDNFRVILSGGAQKGAIFEQATYLPDNVKKIHYALTNSVLIATTVTLLTLAFGSLSAYTVARLRLRWVMWLMNLNVFARFVPVIVVMIPLYVTFRQLGLLNSVWGVIIAETGFLLPYGVVILAPYFATVPRELEEAARIDGCSRFGAFLRVTLPLSTPALASYGAIVFIVAWNDLLIPLILNNRAEFMTCRS
jgi:multiple sugar transport system permease protein